MNVSGAVQMLEAEQSVTLRRRPRPSVCLKDKADRRRRRLRRLRGRRPNGLATLHLRQNETERDGRRNEVSVYRSRMWQEQSG